MTIKKNLTSQQMMPTCEILLSIDAQCYILEIMPSSVLRMNWMR